MIRKHTKMMKQFHIHIPFLLLSDPWPLPAFTLTGHDYTCLTFFLQKKETRFPQECNLKR